MRTDPSVSCVRLLLNGRTYRGDTAIAKVDAKVIQNQEPRLRIFKGHPHLIPLKRANVHDTRLVLQCPLQRNGAFLLFEKDGILGAIGQQCDQPERQARGHGTQNEEDQLPLSDRVDCDVSNAIDDHTADEVGDAVSEIPGGLSGMVSYLDPIK